MLPFSSGVKFGKDIPRSSSVTTDDAWPVKPSPTERELRKELWTMENGSPLGIAFVESLICGRIEGPERATSSEWFFL